jgi:hypothetical protein
LLQHSRCLRACGLQLHRSVIDPGVIHARVPGKEIAAASQASYLI